jgi:fatty-acyl-CoA synthase
MPAPTDADEIRSARTVVDAILDRAGGTGTLTILDGAGGAVTTSTWRAVHDHARRMSSVFAGWGFGRGARIGLLSDTCEDLVAALQAAWLTGGAVTVLAPPISADVRSYLDHVSAVVRDAALDLVVVDNRAAAVGAVLSASTRVVSLADLVQSAASAAPAPPVRPHPTDLAVLQYTSGSTRSPRGVPVTHGHLAANVAAIKVAIDHENLHPSRTLSWLPLYHDMGLVGFLTLPMSCGCSLYLQSPATFARRPASWPEAMSRHRITVSGAPNFAYGLMSRLLAGSVAVDLSSMRLLLCGGEPIGAATMAAFAGAARRHGLDPSVIAPAYGLAESTLAVSIAAKGAGVRVDRVDAYQLETHGLAEPADLDGRVRQLVRLGRPVPGTTVRIVDESTGEPAGERRVGHIEIRGPSVVDHHHGDPAPPAGSWIRTGDLGYFADGELIVCGRATEMFFAAGRNVFPQDVEAAAAEVPGVRLGGVAAFGLPGEHGDRLVVAVESRGRDPEAVRAEVAAAVRGEVGLTPTDVVTLPFGRLPRTSSGKLRRAETRQRYQAATLTGPKSQPLVADRRT